MLISTSSAPAAEAAAAARAGNGTDDAATTCGTGTIIDAVAVATAADDVVGVDGTTGVTDVMGSACC